MIVDRLENWSLYFQQAPWQCAFEYLAKLGPQSPPGDWVQLRGDDIRARIMQYETKGLEGAEIEAHDKFIDIQMSLAGAEVIEWFPRIGLEVSKPYDDAGDAVMFKRPGPPPVRVVNAPGLFTVLFPEDGHLPGQNVSDAPDTVTKVVVKVRRDLVRLGKT